MPGSRLGRSAALAAALAAALVIGPNAGAGEAIRVGKLPPADEEPSYLCSPGVNLSAVGARVTWPYGRDLWLIDPLPRSLAVVRDFGAGPYAGSVGVPVEAGGVGYLLGSDGFASGLWATDFTAAGTRLAVALDPALGAGKLTAWNGRAYFIARHPQKDFPVVWTSDGTLAGTTYLVGGPANAWLLEPGSRGLLCAVRTEGIGAAALWVVDGTATGSRSLTTLPSPSQVHAVARFANGFLVVLSRGASYWSWELWFTDLTLAGTRLITGLPEAVDVDDAGGWLGAALSIGVFTTVEGYGSDARRSLWRTDGTAAGTFRLEPAGADGFAPAEPAFYAGTADAVLFAGRDAAHGVELWRTDGSAAGTALVADINPGTRGSAPQWLTAAGGEVYFTATDVFAGREPWVSDGREEGTRRVTDLCPGPFGSFYSYGPYYGDSSGRPLVAAADRAVFAASTGMGGCGFWVSDGTEGGTLPIEPAVGAAGAPVSEALAGAAATEPDLPRLLAVNGSVLTQFGGPWYWSDVWRTDGTGGSFEASGIDALARLFDPPQRGWLHGLPYFAARSTVMRGDGTDAGTVPAFPGTISLPSPGESGVFYFWRDGPELWRSDGTEAGTRRVRRFASGTFTPGGIAQRDGIAYFAASDGTAGPEPWRSDGTDAGTGMVADVCAGSCSYQPAAPVASGNQVFFRLGSPAGVLATDGTAAGTRAVHWGSVSQAVPLAGGLLMGDGAGGLYFTDGSATPSQRLAAFRSVRLPAAVAAAGAPQAPLLFQAQDDTHGAELWRTDGTVAGTALVRDIAPGAESSAPSYFVQVAGRTWFAASDPEHGAELWSSDGSEAGTRLEADVEAGPRGSVPLGLAVAGNRVVFRPALLADELWAARATPLPRVDAWSAWAAAGPAGDGFARVAVTLDEPAAVEVSVAYATEDDTARAGADYVPVGGRLVFAAGTTGPRHVVIPLVAGAAPRQTSQLFVRLSAPAGAVVGRGTATVTVADERAGRSEPRRRVRSGGGSP